MRPATPSTSRRCSLVDGATVTSDADKLAKVTVTAEVVKPAKGPKITIMKYKNKTGYRKRQGHRQHADPGQDHRDRGLSLAPADLTDRH